MWRLQPVGNDIDMYSNGKGEKVQTVGGLFCSKMHILELNVTKEFAFL